MRRFLAVLWLSFFPLVVLAAAPPVLVLGDSLSAAHGIPLQTGWVTLLGKRLDAADASPRRAVVNASISGETTSGGLARLPALLAEHKPGVVVVELGANDGLRGLSLPDIRKNVASLVKLSRDAGAKVVLVGIELPVNYGPQYRDGLRAMYRDVAAEFNVPLVPFLLEGVALDPALMQDDGLHPVAAAQPKILDTVWAVLGGVVAAK
ncbi:MAG TPA: arylesterase [Tahibacter sp.]|nr:arylesterase [Tahibacter sp.]